ncbi:MAG: DUF4290 domain-containing protein [Candidatus Shikimatogenerans bostrichidophilus]|nr:MAG: DUF4290 domain-containing protein [Candidatus Shikimatogenerans bostrichidophilus]
MEYNTSRNNIIIPEYGRNVQKLVEYTIKKIKNKKKIINNFNYIIKIIKIIRPNYKINILNLKNNLWYKLFLKSKLKINDNLPFYIKKKQKIKKNKIKYPNILKKYKYYGKIIQKIINKLTIKDKNKYNLIYKIANLMKYNYIKWNKIINVKDDIILNDIKIISKGKINIIKNFKPLEKFKNNYIYKKKKYIYKKKNFYKKKKFFK